VASVRQKIVTAAHWGIRHEPQIHYGEIRPIPLGQTLPLTTDCSGFVTICYFLAGAPDPNGLDYCGQGWTGTLLRNLSVVMPEDARRGDLVVWGEFPGWHVALLLEPGEDPLLCSHGQEHGPLAIRFSDEDRWQWPRTSIWLDGLS
jgi:cell wall-associated NlpC family hydrolase